MPLIPEVSGLQRWKWKVKFRYVVVLREAFIAVQCASLERRLLKLCGHDRKSYCNVLNRDWQQPRRRKCATFRASSINSPLVIKNIQQHFSLSKGCIIGPIPIRPFSDTKHELNDALFKKNITIWKYQLCITTFRKTFEMWKPSFVLLSFIGIWVVYFDL